MKKILDQTMKHPKPKFWVPNPPITNFHSIKSTHYDLAKPQNEMVLFTEHYVSLSYYTDMVFTDDLSS